MKTLEGRTHYDILDITVDADEARIRRAYHEALAIYTEDALATYTLFADGQRAEMVRAIEAAYHTLVDPDRRADYNRMLALSGRVDAARMPDPVEPAPPPAPDPPAAVKHHDLSAWVQQQFKDDTIRRLAEEVVGLEAISGTDLKRLREALGIEVVEVFQHTRIPKATLQMIEANQYATLPEDLFLKSFLKTYAQTLQIDPQRVVTGYLQHRSSAKPGD